MQKSDVVSAFYAAVAAGDVPGVLGVLAERLEWTEAAGFPYFSGTWRNPMDVVEKLLIPIGRDWDDFKAAPREILDLGDRVLSLGTYSGISKATGKAMEAPFAHIWRVEDGRITRFDMYTDTKLIADAMQ